MVTPPRGPGVSVEGVQEVDDVREAEIASEVQDALMSLMGIPVAREAPEDPSFEHIEISFDRVLAVLAQIDSFTAVGAFKEREKDSLDGSDEVNDLFGLYVDKRGRKKELGAKAAFKVFAKAQLTDDAIKQMLVNPYNNIFKLPAPVGDEAKTQQFYLNAGGGSEVFTLEFCNLLFYIYDHALAFLFSQVQKDPEVGLSAVAGLFIPAIQELECNAKMLLILTALRQIFATCDNPLALINKMARGGAGQFLLTKALCDQSVDKAAMPAIEGKMREQLRIITGAMTDKISDMRTKLGLPPEAPSAAPQQRRRSSWLRRGGST